MIDRPATSWYGPRALRLSTVGHVVCAACAALVTGCGPIEYINQVGNKAASAVSAAKAADAERWAPYELTAAEEYLHKAREEAGHAEYQDAIDYGKKSEELANRARAIAVSRSGPASAAPAAKRRDSE